MRITVLAGGIGGAKFLRGVRAACPDDEITAVVNTGDDVTLHGLRICPDLDSVMYTLAGANDVERGWGREGESWRIQEEFKAYGAEPSWFNLGDLDIATHLVRTRMLDAGYPLSAVTAALCERWQPGITMLPMTDDRCETHVIVELDGADDDAARASARRKAIHFQEWWVRYRSTLPAQGFVQVGLDDAEPAPGVLEAITTADAVLLAPSNPVVSIGTILGLPEIREAVQSTPAPVAGLSPIIGGAPVRGMADSCLPAIGVEVSAEGVGRHYGARSSGGTPDSEDGGTPSSEGVVAGGVALGGGGLLDVWLIHDTDAADVPGVDVRAVPLLMTDDNATAAMVKVALS